MPRQKPEYIKFLKVEFSNGVHIPALIEHIEAIELELKISKEDEQEAVRKYGEAELNIDRLIDNCAQLKRENKRLMDEVDEAREPKKVSLPKEVAEALDSFKKDGHDVDYIVRVLAMNSDEKALNRLKTIKRYAIHHGYELIAALANGYTVEKTKEERLREGLNEVIREWYFEPASTDNDVNIKEALSRIYSFVTKFNADNG